MKQQELFDPNNNDKRLKIGDTLLDILADFLAMGEDFPTIESDLRAYYPTFAVQKEKTKLYASGDYRGLSLSVTFSEDSEIQPRSNVRLPRMKITITINGHYYIDRDEQA